MINWSEKWAQVTRIWLTTHFNILVFLFVVVLSATLCFCGLGNRTLWQDEGETAVLAQRVLSGGVPRALSGYNLVYQSQGGPQYDKNYRWTYHPWGQFYLTAASFAVLGQTNFAARFPFALCGVLTVALLYVFVWRHWRSLAAAFLSALLLATSTAFVLHCRQCRYYGLSAFTCLSAVVVFVELMKKPCRQWWITFGVVLAAQFYADFGTLAVLLPGLALSLWPMGARKQQLIAVAKASGLAILVMIPGLILHWDRLTAAGGGNHRFLMILLFHIYYFDNWFVPLVFLVPAGGVFVWRLVKSRERLSEQDRIVITCALVIGSIMTGMTWAAPYPYVRYLISSASLARLLLAVILIEGYIILRKKALPVLPARMVFISSLLILMFSNIFALPTQYLIYKYHRYLFKALDFCSKSSPFVRAEFAGLVYEITHDFVSPDRLAVNVAGDLVRSDETVVMDYGELVLLFYRPDLRIYSSDTLSNLKGPPDLVILCQVPSRIRAFFKELREKNDHIYFAFSVPITSAGGNNAELGEHWFATPSVRRPLYILLRRDHEDRISRLPQTDEELEARWFRRR